jgi:hypothetical protein
MRFIQDDQRRFRSARRLTPALLVIPAMLFGHRVAGDDSFEKHIAPILERRCLNCHNATERKGGLSIATRDDLLRGGDGGEVVSIGDPDGSPLVEQVTPVNGKAAMPKKADALSANEIAALRDWIKRGAPWPKDRRLKEAKVADTDWWSLRHLARPAVPTVPDRAKWIRNPVDAFIAAKHVEVGLTPAPEADRRTLIRRLYFDLIGLPPTPEGADAFVADPDQRAYEKLVDKLLASPQHGERWARHWLDVAHFGETHGYDKDKPRPNAWPYRDYVIRSFNEDKPFARFVQEQIAGDVLFPGTVDGIEALGFIAAGPWDFIGHAELPETKIDGKIARHLDRDDMVSNTINTFCSLTVHCAQCHNHKFDPITQEDYYALQAVFAALDRADKKYDADPAVSKLRSELESRQRDLTARRTAFEAEVARQAGPELAEIDKQIAAASKPVERPPEYGYHSGIESTPDKPKWVQVNLGQSVAIAKLELFPCHDDFNNIGAGFGFPVRYRIELSDDAEFKSDVTVLVDRTQADVANPGITPQVADVGGKSGRFVRVTATKLAPRQNDFIFAVAELKVVDAAGTNVARGDTVTALDSIEAPIRWSKKNLVDGLHPGAVPGSADVAALTARRQELLDRKVDAALRRDLEAARKSLDDIARELAKLPPPRLVFAGTIHHGSGSFIGTGANYGRPRPIHVLPRGDVTKPGPEVRPGALAAVAALPARFELSSDATEGARRAALAQWLTHRDNPLTWRSIVNRVWLYHFGRGLVDTPNDFGRMGQLPSHPELIDWLAVEFRDGGQSLKSLHRLIVTSATYRQASSRIADFRLPIAELKRPTDNFSSNRQSAIGNRQFFDAENRYLSHQNRRRLEAEAIRDSILFASGRLTLTMGGPSFQDFVIERTEHSPHYEYHLHNADDPASHRRSIYRFLVRSHLQPFMTTLDCADPSMLVDKRTQTITPLQALALLNNQLTVVMSRHFAARIEKSDGDISSQVTEAFRVALSRSPTADELRDLTAFAGEHGLSNTCRLLMNLNEFVFVD